jgi:hypothetical protein
VTEVTVIDRKAGLGISSLQRQRRSAQLQQLVDHYANNWFQEGGRYPLARLDRPEGAACAALSKQPRQRRRAL